jgi:biotin/methionine sulfoxide reductase
MHPDDATARELTSGDTARVFNDRGACLATVVLDDGVLAGVVRMSTGAWLDVESADGRIGLERHGNPNVLTSDLASSSLSQATAAQTCLVEVERYEGEAPAVAAFHAPPLSRLRNSGA